VSAVDTDDRLRIVAMHAEFAAAAMRALERCVHDAPPNRRPILRPASTASRARSMHPFECGRLWTAMPDLMHEQAVPPDFNAVMKEREQVVGLSPRDAIVLASDCLNCRGVVVHVDVYELVSEHGREHLDCRAASPCPDPDLARIWLRDH
jgi:hypothetical protein